MVPKPTDHDLGMKLMASRLNELQDDHINSMLYADLKESLPGDMLKKVDAMSMFHSLEVRVPLLDHRVCELAFSMRGDWKLRNGKSKYVLVGNLQGYSAPFPAQPAQMGIRDAYQQMAQDGLEISDRGISLQGRYHAAGHLQLRCHSGACE